MTFKERFNKIVEENGMFITVLALIFYILLTVLAVAGTWAVVSVFVYLISICFGFVYTLLLGTGVWLVCAFVFIFIKAIIKSNL